ncbi:MAG: pyruvate:ferredoxin (flavodoxin) oxidoreductase [Senegalimassilia anaerobia]|uniref:pyruvate:ferredoxin (flavodoxin) oxidoreductase n=1 Tax=Senegalimassilia anaerobia TaxID=1473216 RepID=UPI002E76ABD2|nr:pyruvate:ferredoxin (flavodoxin) oxidoreductase [Senegalimassilia anaerobia]MEE0304474.1 pyruvate:ferredoxin (flavodoxin) oxidoreductase [Senegalimassilia anaerobia]
MSNYVTVDGNQAAAHVAYDFTEVAAIYPITPSSPMAEHTDRWSAQGRLNMFGQRVQLTEMQSEAGAIAAIHGVLQAGGLGTSFTSSQGLMLMVPVLYRIAGERLPGVLHVASRTVGTHAMSIFGDHSDVMACRDTGFAQLSSGSVQEAADMAAVAHLAAVKASIPFMHFFDGFRTSHELSRIDMPDTKELTALMDAEALDRFRARALNPEHPMLRATVQNGDTYFQQREANNTAYDQLADVVEGVMAQVAGVTGRKHHVFDYYGAADATDVVVAMGSVSGTAQEACDYLNARAQADGSGKRYGYLQVHLYRPFSAKHFLGALPETVQRIAVLDRCKCMGSAGEPLYLDVSNVIANSSRAGKVTVIGGRYGLASKDTDTAQIVAVFDNLAAPEPTCSFTIGINDDVTNLSLPVRPLEDFEDGDTYSCKFWGLGGDGTVGANHNTIRILGDCADMYAQAYFEYDSKKSFGVTKSHLRLSKKPIRSTYYVKRADFVACHNQSYVRQYDMVQEVKPGGTFLLNTSWTREELDANLPGKMKRYIAQNGIRLFTVDAVEVAQRVGLGSHINTVLQAAFFQIAGLMPVEEALDYMKDAARKSYARKGDAVVAKNVAAIEEGAQKCVEVAVPASWADAALDESAAETDVPAVVENILRPVNAQKGDDLPVSAFAGYEDGVIDMGLTAYEKRGIAVKTPAWNAEACIQCNRCTFVCPHAAIRPYLLDRDEAQNAPEGFATVALKGGKNLPEGTRYAIQVSQFDCTSCGSCADVCPAGALDMQPAKLTDQARKLWDFGLTISDKDGAFNPYTVKGSQFKQPLLEFSAACAGCGETPYAKLLTQLFGDRVYWANATGCSQAWGSPFPGIPYTVNKRGFGPAWTNSLFENNAELSLGLFLGSVQQRAVEKARVEKLSRALTHGLEKPKADAGDTPDAAVMSAMEAACEDYLAAFDDFDASRKAADALVACAQASMGKLTNSAQEVCDEVLKFKDQLAKKTFWMFGGDGWAYDIGFGGLDHVVASGANVNVLVVDTEVYSNTGGQSSKATPAGAVAQFAASGKKTGKKDLGAILMSYGNVYVAQVAMGANYNQLVKVLKEAEEYEGPSVIIAYAPCTSHGLKCGMHDVQGEMKRAVESGYWSLYHYDPRKENPMTLDSKEPTMDYLDFVAGENRFASLTKSFPEEAERLFEQGKEDAQRRFDHYRRMAQEQ